MSIFLLSDAFFILFYHLSVFLTLLFRNTQELLSRNRELLEEKIRVAAFLELVFSINATNRFATFDQIAAVTFVPKSEFSSFSFSFFHFKIFFLFFYVFNKLGLNYL